MQNEAHKKLMTDKWILLTEPSQCCLIANIFTMFRKHFNNDCYARQLPLKIPKTSLLQISMTYSSHMRTWDYAANYKVLHLLLLISTEIQRF